MRGTDELTRVSLDAAVKLRRVRLLVTIVLVGTVASIAFHYVGGYWLGWDYPRSTFLFIPGDHLADWKNPYAYAQTLLRGDPAAPLIYFPFAFLVTAATTMLPMWLGLVVLAAAFLLVLAFMLREWAVDLEPDALVRLQYGFVLVALSYPVLFALDRANPELLIFVLLAGFLCFLYVRKPAWLAVLFLAAAIAYKLYPATFLLLLLAERRLKLCAFTILLALALTAAGTGFLTLEGGYGLGKLWDLSSKEKAVYQEIMVTKGGGVQHGHSLWGLTRVPGLLMGADWVRPVGFQTSLYPAAAALIFVLIALHVVFREKERWKQVLLVTVATVLLPFVSADYTLIHLYFPLIFFVNSPRLSRWDTAYVVLFALLLVPVDYYYFSGLHSVSISVAIYPLALAALAVLSVLDRESRGGAWPRRVSLGAEGRGGGPVHRFGRGRS